MLQTWMKDDRDLEGFLKELTVLTNRYNIYIAEAELFDLWYLLNCAEDFGVGCCRRNHYQYVCEDYNDLTFADLPCRELNKD